VPGGIAQAAANAADIAGVNFAEVNIAGVNNTGIR
jgi:hypothetical protein